MARGRSRPGEAAVDLGRDGDTATDQVRAADHAAQPTQSVRSITADKR